MDVAFQTGLICRHFRGRESCQCGCREHNSHARMKQRSPALSPPCFVAGTAPLTGDDPSLCLPPREEGGKAPSDKLSPGTAAWAEPRLTAPAVPGAWALQCTPSLHCSPELHPAPSVPGAGSTASPGEPVPHRAPSCAVPRPGMAASRSCCVTPALEMAAQPNCEEREREKH